MGYNKIQELLDDKEQAIKEFGSLVRSCEMMYDEYQNKINEEKAKNPNSLYLEDLSIFKDAYLYCEQCITKALNHFKKIKVNSISERKSRFNERRANYSLELDFDINKWKIKEFVRNFEFFNELNFDGINDLDNVNVLKISANDIEVLEEFIVYYLGGAGYDKQEYEFLRKTIKSW